MSPYTELELEYTMRATLASTHASSRRTVALTFAAWDAQGSLSDRGTLGRAAR